MFKENSLNLFKVMAKSDTRFDNIEFLKNIIFYIFDFGILFNIMLSTHF